MCPFCGSPAADLAAHYASDGCPALVTAFGCVTPAGQQAEREQAQRNRLIAGNHYRLPEFERIALANDALWYKERMNALMYERKLRGRKCKPPRWSGAAVGRNSDIERC